MNKDKFLKLAEDLCTTLELTDPSFYESDKKILMDAITYAYEEGYKQGRLDEYDVLLGR